MQTALRTAGIAILLVALQPGPARLEPRKAHERIFATEDSLRTYVVPETTRVVAKRMALAEIIRKAQEGEEHKYDGITTLAFDRLIKITLAYGDSLGKKRCFESVSRVYYRAPSDWSEVSLRDTTYAVDPDGTAKRWSPKDKNGENGGDDVQINFDDSDESGRKLAELPPYLADTDKFNFRILNRSLRPDQVLYEIGFEPRSDFEVLPGGRVWLLTSGYQIVREEYHVKNLPVPWILKSLGLLTRDWQQIDGRWLPNRITARVGLRSGIGLGIVEIPKVLEIVIQYARYQIDPTLDPALFDRKSR